jgi:hypothetical protein
MVFTMKSSGGVPEPDHEASDHVVAVTPSGNE